METIIIDNFEFLFDDDGAALISVKNKNSLSGKILKIPARVGTVPIREIKSKCFVSLTLDVLDLSEVNVSILYSYTFSHDEICDNLILPQNLKIIEKSCCTNCQLGEILLPASIEEIGGSAFSGSRAKISFPENTRIFMGPSAFYGCIIESLIVYPMWKLAVDAFRCCGIKFIEIKQGVTNIPMGCFTSNYIKSLILPESIKKIGDNAFACNSISLLDVRSEHDLYLGKNSFKNNKLSGILDLSEFVGKISLGAFEFNKLNSIILSDYITIIESRAFANNCIRNIPAPPKFINFIDEFAFADQKL